MVAIEVKKVGHGGFCLSSAPESTCSEKRLHKRISESGVCSRRTAESLIEQGRVMVNGHVVTSMGVKVTDDDEVRVDGELISQPRLMYLAMNKPKGVVTTLSDPQGRRTVNDLLPALSTQLKPVGRLDKDTEGLLLFTNDGTLALRMTHPRYGLQKEYVVTVDGIVPEIKLMKLVKGIWIPEGGKTSPASISQVHRDESANRTHFHIAIHEGRKRQIRLMGEAIGHRVRALKRVRVGPIELQGLQKGTCRMLSKPEVDALFIAVGLKPPSDAVREARKSRKSKVAVSSV